MSLSERFRAAAATRDLLAALPVNPTDIVIDEVVSATEAMIHGRRTIMAGTNNYLGLTFDPQCIEAGQRALRKQGRGGLLSFIDRPGAGGEDLRTKFGG